MRKGLAFCGAYVFFFLSPAPLLLLSGLADDCFNVAAKQIYCIDEATFRCGDQGGRNACMMLSDAQGEKEIWTGDFSCVNVNNKNCDVTTNDAICYQKWSCRWEAAVGKCTKDMAVVTAYKKTYTTTDCE